MSQGINKCIFIGSLGADPDMRYTASGTTVANISVAVSESWKDKNTGQKQERTEWVRVSAFGRLAEIMGQYLAKGSKVYIEGRMQTDKWTAQDGQDRYTTKIICRDLQMLDSRNSQPQQQPQQPAQQTQQQAQNYQQASQGFQQPPPQQPTQQSIDDDLDDEIPFG